MSKATEMLILFFTAIGVLFVGCVLLAIPVTLISLLIWVILTFLMGTNIPFLMVVGVVLLIVIVKDILF